jgi:hypothetical protein
MRFQISAIILLFTANFLSTNAYTHVYFKALISGKDFVYGKAFNDISFDKKLNVTMLYFYNEFSRSLILSLLTFDENGTVLRKQR